MWFYIDVKTNEVHSFKFFVSLNFKKLKNESFKVVKNIDVDDASKNLNNKINNVLARLALKTTIKSIQNYQLIEIC